MASLKLIYSAYGESVLGVWILVLAATGLATAADLGITSAAVNLLAGPMASAEGDRRVTALVSTSTAALGAIGIAVSVVLLLGIWCTQFPLRILGRGVVGATDLRIALTIAVVVTVTFYWSSLATAIWTSLQRIDLNAVGDLGAKAIGTLLLGIGLLVGADTLWFLTAVMLLPSLCSRLILWGSVIRSRPATRPRISGCSMPVLRELAPSSGWFFLSSLAELSFSQSMPFVVAASWGPTGVARFSATYQIFNAGFLMIATVLWPLWPAIAEAHASRDEKWLRFVSRMLIRRASVLSVLGFGGIGLGVDRVVSIWMGPELVPSAGFRLACVVLFVTWSVTTAVVVMLTGLNRLSYRLASVVALATVGIASQVLLTPRFGLTGTALGVLVGLALGQLPVAALGLTRTKLPPRVAAL